MRALKFYKEEYENTGIYVWRIYVKNFPFDRDHLLIVDEAGVILDNLSEDGNEVTLEVSTGPIPFSDGVLERTQKLGLFKGAKYKEKEGFDIPNREFQDKIWLRPVTLLLYGRYPKKLWFRKVDF